MTELDYDTFARAFRRVMDAFPKFRIIPAKVTDVTRAYFRVLEAHQLEAVLLAGKGCITTLKTFPAAAEWLAALPAIPVNRADVRQMSVAELEELDRAHALRYEDHPCLCTECCRAGVDDKPLRFVPTLLLDEGYERAFNPRRNAIEIPGHWAHGDELRRFYEAQGHFMALRARSPLRHMPPLQLVAAREPGSDD